MDQEKVVSFLKDHSHISGLGNFDDRGEPISDHGGLVCQEGARGCAAYAIKHVLSKQLAGETVLLVGSQSTGKSAVSAAILKELELLNIPFAMISASEVFTYKTRVNDKGEAIVKKEVTFLFAESFRRSVCVQAGKEVHARLVPGVLLITGLELPSDEASTFFVDLAKARDQLKFSSIVPTFLVVANYRPKLKLKLNEANGCYYPVGTPPTNIKFIICSERYDEEEIEKVFQVIAQFAGFTICEPALKYLMEIFRKGSYCLAHQVLKEILKCKTGESPAINLKNAKEVVIQMKLTGVDIPI